MSRIGRMPVTIPSGVSVSFEDRVLKVRGPKAELSQRLPKGITLEEKEGSYEVTRRDDSKQQRAFHGLSRALMANMVQGVSQGFQKVMEIHGVGYRVELKGRDLHFSLGYSHPVIFKLPEGIDAQLEKNNVITISGADRQLVGQVSADIRKLRKPDPYKLKGIRYRGEHLKKKAGKTGA